MEGGHRYHLQGRARQFMTAWPQCEGVMKHHLSHDLRALLRYLQATDVLGLHYLDIYIYITRYDIHINSPA